MQIVRQMHVGWIGVMDGDIVDNGTVVFTLDGARRRQMTPHAPDKKELKELHKRLVDSQSKYADYVGGLLCSTR